MIYCFFHALLFRGLPSFGDMEEFFGPRMSGLMEFLVNGGRVLQEGVWFTLPLFGAMAGFHIWAITRQNPQHRRAIGILALLGVMLVFFILFLASQITFPRLVLIHPAVSR